MDGLHLSVPGGKPQPETEQLDLFSMFGAAEAAAARRYPAK